MSSSLATSAKSLRLTGQKLEDGVQKKAEVYLRCPVVGLYGTQELAGMGMECRDTPGRYHLFSERIIVEILDENGTPLPTGEVGNVAITCLDNVLMPLIRYLPGDVGSLHEPERCRCKAASPLPLLEIDGRATDTLLFSDGNTRRVSPLLRLFKNESLVQQVRRIQVQQKELDAVEIYLEVRGAKVTDSALEALSAGIESLYGKRLRFAIVQVTLIEQPEKKFKVFIPLKK